MGFNANCSALLSWQASSSSTMCSQAVVSSRPDCVTKDPGGFSKSELEPQTSTRGYRLRVREVHKYFRAARGIRVLARLGFPSFEFAQIRVMLLWPHIRLLCLGNIILSQLGQRKTRSQCASDRQIRGLAKQPSKRHSVSDRLGAQVRTLF